MTKIFKQLARHWAACLAVAALLIVQAYCDLSLPDYTSKIVASSRAVSKARYRIPSAILPCRHWNC